MTDIVCQFVIFGLLYGYSKCFKGTGMTLKEEKIVGIIVYISMTVCLLLAFKNCIILMFSF